MTKPRDVKNNLIAAKFAFPEREWTATPEGLVVTFGAKCDVSIFELDNPRDRQHVLIKLKRDHGWDVKAIRKGKAYQAKHTNGVTIERPSLPALIVDLIGRVKG